MKLGAFSISLAVKDIDASQTFYSNLGFEVAGGDTDQGWLILRNGSSVIGLFQGMFEENLLTFNPGWDQDASPLENFKDVREIQSELKSKGIALQREADPDSTGPTSIVVTDPDGNAILIDQHV